MATSHERIDILINLVMGTGAARAMSGLVKGLSEGTLAATTLSRSLSVLGRAFGVVGRQIATAIGFYVKFRIFSVIYRGVNLLTDAIPDLINRGEAWASTLLRIQDVTGMAAEETGKLAGVARLLGIDAEKLGRDLSYLGRNVIENEQHFRDFGIRVRDADGVLKSSFDIFTAVRRAVSEYGRSFMSTAAAQRIFSEGGRDLLRLLQLTDPQWQALVKQARQAGLVMTEAGLRAARAWERTKDHIDAVVTGLGAQILGGVAPALSALVNGIAGAIKANMDQIVEFVSRIVVTIAGFVAGLFGIEIKWRAISSAVLDAANATQRARGANIDYSKSADQAERSERRQTNAIERRIEAIDDQLKRLDRVEDRRQARREYQGLLRDISDARKDLSALRNEHLFFTGMSLVEGELARQAHAADIIEGEERLAEAKKALREWERDQELAAERNRLTDLRDNLQERLSELASATTRAVDTMTKGLQRFPQAVKGIKGAVLELSDDLKELFGGAAQHGKNFQGFLLDVVRVMQGILDIVRSVAEFFNIIPTQREANRAKAQGMYGGVEGMDEPPRLRRQEAVAKVQGMYGGVVGQPRNRSLLKDIQDTLFPPGIPMGPRSSGPHLPQGRFNDTARMMAGGREARKEYVQGLYGGVLGRPLAKETLTSGDSFFGGGSASGGGGGRTQGWRARTDPMEQEKALRKFFGRSSDFHKGQREQNAELGSIIGNTDPLTSGELGTKVGKWSAGRIDVENPRIGEVERWRVGPIGVDSPKYQDIGMMRGWFVAPIGVQHGKFGEIGDVNRWNVSPIGVQHGRFDRIGRVDEWGAGTIGTNVHNRVGAAIEQWGVGRDIGTVVGDWQVPGRLPTRTDIEASSVNNLPTRVIGWATRAEANVDVTSMSTDAARTFAGQFAAIFGPLRHAMGGSVAAKTPIIVGEEGPEIYTPQAGGTIYSNPETRRFLGRGTSGGTGVGGAMAITLQLDPAATRSLLEGRAVNTSTRAGRGV
jgi:hypothetical protein